MKKGAAKAAPFHIWCLKGLLGLSRLEVGAGLLIDALHRQLHLATVVKADDLDLDQLSNLHHVLDALNVVVGEFGDVTESVATR